MPTKRVFLWQPDNFATVDNDQIFDEVAGLMNTIAVMQRLNWRSGFTYAEPIVHDLLQEAPFPRHLFGVTLTDQIDNYYLILHDQRIILEADWSMQTIMGRLESYDAIYEHYVQGYEFKYADFRWRVGKVISNGVGPLRGTVMEVDYLPVSSLEQSKNHLDNILRLFEQRLATTRPILHRHGHFEPVVPLYSAFGLTENDYTLQHTALEYYDLMFKLAEHKHFANRVRTRK